jgi:hypothetical protein
MIMDSIESPFQAVLTHCQNSASQMVFLCSLLASVVSTQISAIPVHVVWSVSEWFVHYHINNL